MGRAGGLREAARCQGTGASCCPWPEQRAGPQRLQGSEEKMRWGKGSGRIDSGCGSAYNHFDPEPKVWRRDLHLRKMTVRRRKGREESR